MLLSTLVSFQQGNSVTQKFFISGRYSPQLQQTARKQNKSLKDYLKCEWVTKNFGLADAPA